MKTTVDIPDGLADQLRERAARDGTSLRAIIQAALRQFLGRPASACSNGAPRFSLTDASVPGDGLAPGVEEGNWAQVRNLAYGGRGGTSV